MKKLLLFLMLLFFLDAAFGTIKWDIMQVCEKKKEIPVKGSAGVPIFRSSINYPPLQAFVSEKVLTIHFLESLGTVLVKVRNVETKEVVLTASYEAKSDVVINVFVWDAGEYEVSFVTEGYEVWGEFSVTG